MEESGERISRDHNVSRHSQDLSRQSIAMENPTTQPLDITELIADDPNQSTDHRHNHLYQRHYLLTRPDLLTAAYQIKLTYYPPPEKRDAADPALLASLARDLRPSELLQSLGRFRCARGANCPRQAGLVDGGEELLSPGLDMVYCVDEQLWLCAEECNRLHHREYYKEEIYQVKIEQMDESGAVGAAGVGMLQSFGNDRHLMPPHSRESANTIHNSNASAAHSYPSQPQWAEKKRTPEDHNSSI